MKRTILTVALLALCAAANAQMSDFFYKLEGGAVFGKLSSTVYDSKMGTGWMARGYVQIFETDNAGLEAGVGVQDLRSSNAIPVIGGKWQVMNIEVPLRSVYRLDLGMATVAPAVGLYFSYGLKATDGTLNLYRSGVDALKRFNMGIDATIDFILVDFIKIGVGYQYGWINMSKAEVGKLRPWALSVTAGVTF